MRSVDGRPHPAAPSHDAWERAMGCLGTAFGLFILTAWTGGGLFFLAEQKAHGESTLLPIVLVAPSLFIWAGLLAVTVERRVVPSYRRGRSRLPAIATAALGLVATVGIYLAVDATVLNRRPSAELTAALAPACAGDPVADAGALRTSGSPPNHLVVLDTSGKEHAWTGHPAVDLRPASLSDAELVVCVSNEETTAQLEVCHYVNGPDITRYSASRRVAVYAAATGQRILAYSPTAAARACQKTEPKDVTELFGSLDWEQVAGELWYVIERGADPATAVAVSGPVILDPGETDAVGLVLTSETDLAVAFTGVLRYPGPNGAPLTIELDAQALAPHEQRVLVAWATGLAPESSMAVEVASATVLRGEMDPEMVARRASITIEPPSLPIASPATTGAAPIQVGVRSSATETLTVRVVVGFLRAGSLVAVGSVDIPTLAAGAREVVTLEMAGDPSGSDHAIGQLDWVNPIG